MVQILSSQSVTAKLQQLEITLSKTTEALLSKQQPSSSHETSFTVRSHNTREESREREANQWWRWLQRTHKDEGKEVTWEIFVEELWAQFGPTDCEDFNEALSKIKQTGSLRDYQKEFERLGNRVHSWTQKALVETFMGGLKIDIADVGTKCKENDLAVFVSIVMRDSDERFTPGHKCQGPKLLLLKGNSSDTDDDKGEGVTDLQDKDAPEISLYALTRWSTTRTMRAIAKVGPYELMVLIDSRSTHNFINDKVAGLLQLPVVPTKPFNVKIANGKPLTCHGRFENVQEAIKTEAVGHSYMLWIGKLASEKPGEPYIWRNGLVYYKNQVIIPPNSYIIPQLLQEFYDSPLGGHSSVLRTFKRLDQQFYWPSIHKYVGDNNISSTELPPIVDDGEIIVELKAILDTRWVKKGKNIIEESLVKWKKLPIEDATWETIQELWDRFHNLNLDDKVPLLEGSNDKSRRTTRVSIKNPKYMD
ncbi:hypothetical protein JRO89_XS07G0195100 [Xanthoceras sorbifolium]|uniref:Retrotransposon gag domain-containing protein n=1 Tax=Xanthoceras sorbifolium TaxID=99658 RepID=A0ABQ8HUC8_9ROSI|nr:hypothetical protein JRO89_XS07G0195100 [Xanthoceras sorbifolium]